MDDDPDLGPLDAIVDHHSAADLLYGLDPADFVARRDQLAKALRANGQRELATEVKALRKPPIVVAELNRVLRIDRRAVEDLLAMGRRVRDAHRAMLGGETVDIATLRAEHRSAVAALTAHAAPRHRDHLAALLESTSLDEAWHARLQAASFAAEPTPRQGFDLFPPTAADRGGVGPGTGGSGRGRRGATVTSLADARRRRGAPESRSETPSTSAPPTDAGRSDDADGPSDAIDESRVLAKQLVEQAAAAHEGHQRAVTLAKRRLEAMVERRERAGDREADLERRLVEARANTAESERALEAARSAMERAEETAAASASALTEAETALSDLADPG